MVLGRLAQSPPQGRNSGAYYLAEYTDADVQMATQHINTHPRNQFTQPTAQQAPAPQAPAPQPQQWGQAPAAAAPQFPYDQWQNTPTVPAPQPQAAPAGPTPGQWGAPQAAPAPSPAAPLDPQLVAFLQS
ncbi:hypothetical protein ACIBI4_06170 [Streptomyces sp. NPDC050418]|uniref:hypothetical protein n=1 Tax=Streptomyces sp. NPDC050418 TaxID=3365612 RepID=UPI00378B8E62